VISSSKPQGKTRCGEGANRIVSHSTPNPSEIVNKYLKLIEMAVTGSLTDEAGRCNGFARGCPLAELLPYNATLRQEGNDWPPFGHTMVGHARLQNIRDALFDIALKGVPGDFAELGVWRGGSCIFAKAIINTTPELEGRKVHVFDAFETLPPNAYGENYKFLATREDTVRHNFAKYGVLDDNVMFYKGLFNNTVPQFYRDSLSTSLQISVLRIDGNYYDSYQDALYYLYGLVPVGGWVIFDDYYSHPDVQAAWADFSSAQGVAATVTRIDVHGAYVVKTKHVSIDFSRMQAPRDINRP
jgi:hypothetical protein